MKTWQMHDVNEWRYGEMVRGVVRAPYYAEIYHDEEKNPSWIWFVHPPGVIVSKVGGRMNSFHFALEVAEEELRKAGLLE